MDTLTWKFFKRLLKGVLILNSAFLRSNGHQIIRIYQKKSNFWKKISIIFAPPCTPKGEPHISGPEQKYEKSLDKPTQVPEMSKYA